MNEDVYESVFRGSLLTIIMNVFYTMLIIGGVLGAVAMYIGFVTWWMVIVGMLVSGGLIGVLFSIGWKSTSYKMKHKVLLKHVTIAGGDNTSVVQFSDVNSVQKRQSFWEKRAGVGSIVLKTDSGMFKVEFIREWEELYDELCKKCDVEG